MSTYISMAEAVTRTRAKLKAVRKALTIVTNKELRKDLNAEAHKLELLLMHYEVKEESARVMTRAIQEQRLHAGADRKEIRG